MTSTEEWSRQIDRELAELDDRYKRINRMWAESGLPELVRETPDRQAGWWVLQDWVDRRYRVLNDIPLWADRNAPPHWQAMWGNEVHIWSHMMCPGGHSLRHAAIEEEGARLIVEWWAARRGPGNI